MDTLCTQTESQGEMKVFSLILHLKNPETRISQGKRTVLIKVKMHKRRYKKGPFSTLFSIEKWSFFHRLLTWILFNMKYLQVTKEFIKVHNLLKFCKNKIRPLKQSLFNLYNFFFTKTKRNITLYLKAKVQYYLHKN